MYLHHVPSPTEAIKEMARILKVGGKLVITDLGENCCAESSCGSQHASVSIFVALGEK